MLKEEHQKLILKIIPTLNETQARLFVAKEAMMLGHGGYKFMSELTGMSRPTILRGAKALRKSDELTLSQRIRTAGGGRKRIEESQPALNKALSDIMEETTAGGPMSALRWTSKSTTKIAEELNKQGYKISQRTVHNKLSELGYSLQLNAKHKEGTSPKNRDEQFKKINSTVTRFQKQGNPVISVDTKKKEKIGEFKNDGKTWRPKGEPRKVNVYDFPSLAEGTAIPYGTYDVQRNEGFVNAGMTSDTAEFAVNSILQWWESLGHRHYPKAGKILICADGGGSNGSRNRSWKFFLQQLADRLELAITVCHYPPGTSKWNKIEHRLFSFISLNWRGQPLVSYETIVNFIGSTTTNKGLKVKAKPDLKEYKKGIKISDEEMDELNIQYYKANPQWNYTIKPRTMTQKNISKRNHKT